MPGGRCWSSSLGHLFHMINIWCVNPETGLKGANGRCSISGLLLMDKKRSFASGFGDIVAIAAKSRTLGMRA